MREADQEELREATEYAWRYGGIAIQGNWAREHAMTVAMAASLGLLSTRQDRDTYSNVWRITSTGLRFLNELKDY